MGGYFLRQTLGRAVWILGALSLALVAAEIAARWTWFGTHETAPTALGLYVDQWQAEKAAEARVDGDARQQLQRRAFDASFRDRGLDLPPVGPRQGYEGERLLPQRRPCGDLAACESALDLPLLWNLDEAGRQRVGPVDGEVRLLILGDEAALAPFASTLDETYFAVLQEHLAADGPSPSIHVQARRGQSLDQAVDGMILSGIDLEPQAVVLLLDPVRDLPAGALGEGAVAELLRRQRASVRRAARFGRAAGLDVAFALSPDLGAKISRSAVEEELWDLLGSAARSRLRQRLRDEMQRVAEEEGAHFWDYGSLLAGTRGTDFVDLSDVSDRGQEALGRALADDLRPILDPETGSE